jgi:cyclic pyranopterin phosphate synthase
VEGVDLKLKELTHIDSRGEAAMVDVSAKASQAREAVARGEIRLERTTLALIQAHKVAKGNVLATARLAGILISIAIIMRKIGF